MGTGLAGARGVLGGMRAGFRPGRATGDEESRCQKARAKEEGRRPGEEGERPPEGRKRAAEEDKRPRAEGTGSADKPTEKGAKGAAEEGRSPPAEPPGE